MRTGDILGILFVMPLIAAMWLFVIYLAAIAWPVIVKAWRGK